MKSLNEKEWKSFLFPRIFEIKGGFYNKKPKKEENGNIPFLGAIDNNNGMTQFNTVDNIEKTSKTGDDNNADLDDKIFKGNCIVVTNNGSVGYAYYQKHSFTCSHDVNPLYLKDTELNEELACFLIGAIEKQRVCFTYIHKWRPKRMRKSNILLPVDDKGKPDYEYMEQYVKHIKENKKELYKQYCEKQLRKIGDSVNVPALDKKKTLPFFVSDIFDVPKRGKRITSNKYIYGNTPVISSAGGNNGVIAFVGNKDNVRIYNDCLSVANGGVSAGFAFYHPYDFIGTDHITHFKNKGLNRFHYMFIGTIIRNQMHDKYDFSREMTDSRLKREILLLPVNDNNEPDYEYMEQYMKNIMIRKYNQYIEFKS